MISATINQCIAMVSYIVSGCRITQYVSIYINFFSCTDDPYEKLNFGFLYLKP